MDLLLIGFGKMNHLVAELAAARGDRVVKTIAGPQDWSAGWTPGLVAIDFSLGAAVPGNVERCMEAGIPLVIGTTGWYAHLDAVRALVERSHVGAVYGANFSIGVQALYRGLAALASSLPPEYEAYIWEAHHRHKADAPSGTALHLEELLRANGHPPAPTASTRAGFLPGVHTIGFDGPDETITITHNARSRRGFAAGALLAARWILGRRGLHPFSEVIESLAAGEIA